MRLIWVKDETAPAPLRWDSGPGQRVTRHEDGWLYEWIDADGLPQSYKGATAHHPDYLGFPIGVPMVLVRRDDASETARAAALKTIEMNIARFNAAGDHDAAWCQEQALAVLSGRPSAAARPIIR